MSRHQPDLLIDPEEAGELRRPDRLFYAEGVLLSADDLAAEQTYHRGRLARSLAYLHGCGTAAGLRVIWEPAVEASEEQPAGREERLVVQPGLAIDRLGRLIELERNHCLRLGRWFEAQSVSDLRAAFHASEGGVVADVFLRFVACGRAKTPAFASGALDATDSFVPGRLRDSSELILIARDELDEPPPAWPPDLPPDDPPEERQERLELAILNSWAPMIEKPDHYPPTIDPSSLLLARIVLPATLPTAADERPVRTEATITPDNHVRRFVYSSAAMARWVGNLVKENLP